MPCTFHHYILNLIQKSSCPSGVYNLVEKHEKQINIYLVVKSVTRNKVGKVIAFH